MNIQEAMKLRRSRYELTNETPLSKEELESILADCITYTPSAFHSQTSRVVLLLQEEHIKLWSIVESTLRNIVPEDKFGPTKLKLDSFASAYGTILYFEDMNVVEQLQKDFPLYADNFPVWSMQSSGMLQFSVWTSLAAAGLGANLQHYNPLIDEQVKKEFMIPEQWKLIAQMPFGIATAEPQPLDYMPIDQRLLVKGQ